jgi:hypothetical protein
MLHIWEVQDSNFGPETRYAGRNVHEFGQQLQANAEQYLKLGHDSILPHIFKFIALIIPSQLMLL